MSESIEQKMLKFMDVQFEGILPEEAKKIWEKPMSESKYNHAFPTEDYKSEGLSKVEFAAIHLKVPTSGTTWLDEMIEASRRDEFVKALIMATQYDEKTVLRHADALLAASNKRKEGE